MNTDNLYNKLETGPIDIPDIKSEPDSTAESEGEIEFAYWGIKTEEVDVSDMEPESEPVHQMEMSNAEKKAAGCKQTTRVRSTVAQMAMMLEFMESHQAFARGALFGWEGAAKSAELWEELTNLLNSSGLGPSKECAKWQKSWTDWRSSVKARASRNSLLSEITGERYVESKPLSKIDQRVHNISVSDVWDETPHEAGCSKNKDSEHKLVKFYTNCRKHAGQQQPQASKPMDQMNTDVAEIKKALKRAMTTTEDNTCTEGEKRRRLEDEKLALDQARLQLEKERFQFEKTVEKKKLEIKLEKLNLMKMFHEKYSLLFDDIKDIKSALITFLNK